MIRFFNGLSGSQQHCLRKNYSSINQACEQAHDFPLNFLSLYSIIIAIWLDEEMLLEEPGVILI